jgi:hypothetical protein
MPEKHPKRRRDLNQWAKRMVDLATGNAQERDPNEGKDAADVSLGRRGGLKGGKARAAKMSAAQRAEIARKAAKARKCLKLGRKRARLAARRRGSGGSRVLASP